MGADPLGRIHDFILQAARLQYAVVVVGPFQALLHLTTDNPWLNYVVPSSYEDGTLHFDEHLVALRRLFRSRGRRLRFELIEELCPALPKLLERNGLRLESRHPLMSLASRRETLASMEARGVAVRFITEDDDLAAYQALKSMAFGWVRPPRQAQAEQLREQMRQGTKFALATIDDVPVGTGGSLPVNRVCEITGVATLPAMRRRGVASTLTSFLVRDHFDKDGDLAWLTAGDDAAAAVYRRIGFHCVGTLVSYSD